MLKAVHIWFVYVCCIFSLFFFRDETDLVDVSSNQFPVVIGANCTSSVSSNTPKIMRCILCQEEQNIENDNYDDVFVMTCFQQKSTVYSKHSDKRDSIVPELNGLTMTHISSCGHILHSECWNKFYVTVKEKYRPTLLQRQRSCIDVSLTEYLCPLCNSLCNTVLPLLPRFQEEKR